MARFLIPLLLALLLLLTGVAAAVGSWAWLVLATVVLALLVLGVWDLLQRKHAVLRNYPVVGHLRYLLESIRPELQQYFVERNIEGRPFDRYDRSLIYQRAKGLRSE